MSHGHDRTPRIEWNTGAPLATGGSGEVVRAYSPSLGRDIAIKYLRVEEPAAVERMLREARTQAALQHPHILPVHATGEHLGRHFIAMDLVDGQPLDRALAQADMETRLRAFDQVLDAMAYAHAQGVVHRDLKPANLMVEQRFDVDHERPHVWVMDFGLARQLEDATLTVAGDALGTPGYMAPEQARGAEGADPRADIFALGVVLYQLMTGRLPFTADTPMALVMQAASGQIVPIAEIRRRLPDGLARVIIKCLEANPLRRYENAGALRDDLHAFGAGRSVEAPALGRRYRLQRWTRAHPWRARLAAGLAIVIVAGGVALAAIGERNRQALNIASDLIAEAERARSDWYVDQLLPLHDQRPARAEAHATIARVEQRRAELDGAAAARVDAALADLLDAIGESERAFERARQAWQIGLRSYPVAARAARARLQRFGARRLELGLTADAGSLPGLVDQARDSLAADLAPFRKMLTPSLDDFASRAIAGETATQPVPADSPLAKPEDWQGLLLALQPAAIAAVDQLNVEGTDALSNIEPVEAALEHLLTSVRSFLPAYRLGCQLAAARQSLRTMQSSESLDDVSRSACDQALVLAPNDPELLATSSMQLWLTAKDLRRRRQAYDEPLTRSIKQAEAALEVEPGNALAQIAMGSAMQVRARQQLAAGDDPGPALEASRRWLEQVHRARPNDVDIMNNLAVTWNTIAAARLGAGQPRAALAADRKSLDWLERAAQTAPDDRRLIHNMLLARTSLLYQAAMLGEDPTEETRPTVEQLRALADAHPDYISPLNTLGLAWWTQGVWNGWVGQDPAPAMRAAQDAFEEALQRRPDWESARINHAGVARQWYAAATRQPNPALEDRADAALAAYRELEPDDAGQREFGCLIAEVLVARSQWRDDEAADRLLREAYALSDPAQNIEWAHVDCHRTRARMGHLWLDLNGADAPVDVLWADTLKAAEQTEAPGLLIHAARFARARGDEARASEWRSRLPEAFR